MWNVYSFLTGDSQGVPPMISGSNFMFIQYYDHFRENLYLCTTLQMLLDFFYFW